MSVINEELSRRYLANGEGRIHYHDLGAGEPLLLLPAYGPLPGTTAWLTYEKILPQLVERYRCILVDYANFGRSSPKIFREPAHDLFVRDALAVLDHLGVDCVKIIGTSTGGTVALDMALAHPARVERMVIGGCEASTGGDPYLLSPWPSETGRLSYDCQFSPPEKDRIRRLLNSIVFDTALISDELVSQMYEWRLREPEHAEAWQKSESLPSGKLGRLAEIDQPALVVHGRFDRMVPVESAIRLINYLGHADLVILNRCGHWPAFERPRDFARHALQFLSSPLPRP